MRLLKRAPAARAMLRDETLSLTVAAKIQHVARAAEKSEKPLDVHALLVQAAGKSKRDVERILIATAPAAVRVRESVRQIAPEWLEVRLVVDAEFAALLEEAKVLLGSASRAKTLKRALAKAIAQKKRALTLPAACTSVSVPPKTQAKSAIRSRYIPRKLLRAAWARSRGQCEYEGTAGRCPSKHQLQVDHRIPLAAGGITEDKNLRILCAQHNLAEAREWGLVVRNNGRARQYG